MIHSKVGDGNGNQNLGSRLPELQETASKYSRGAEKVKKRENPILAWTSCETWGAAPELWQLFSDLHYPQMTH